ncbi:Crp/Fnr family transcriptional regulator [Caldithrix abyssi]|nr:Crp/Fnr family transcriptional regulator [Caldithrix abyssi]
MNTDLIHTNIAQHISLTDDEVDFFNSILQPRFVKRKEHFFRSGHMCMHENFVTRGCLRTYYIDSEGVERILSFSTENSWTGDTQSFWTQSPTLFNIEALEDTELIQIGKSDLEKLFKRVSKFERFFRMIANDSLIAQQKRIIQSLACSAKERYIDFRRDYPELELRIAQKHIAAYLGITPEFLSALRKKMTNP